MKSETKKYSSILLKGGAIVTITEASTKLVTLLLLPVFSFYLSPEEFGTISMVTIIITTLSLLYNPGLTSATMRLFHDTESIEERRILIGSAHQFYIYIPLICTIMCLIVGPYVFDRLFNDFAFFPFGLMAILLAYFSQTKNIWVTMMMLQYKVAKTALYTFISVILGIVISLILVIIFKLGALGKVLGMFPQVLFIFLIAFVGVKRYTKGEWSISSMKKQLLFGLPLIGTIWSTSLLQVVDRFIIEKMVSLTAVGVYSFAFQISQIPLFFVIGIRKIWNPVFYENMNKKDFKLLKKLVFLYNVILSIICIVIILFSKEFIIIFIDERYHESIPLISILVIGVYFSGLLLVPNSALTYDKKFAMTSKIAFFAILVAITFNILLIPYLGVLGSTISAALAYFLYFIIGYIYSRNITKEIMTFKNLVIPPILVSGATVITFIFGGEWDLTELIIKGLYLIVVTCMLLYVGNIKWSEVKQIIKKREK